MTTMELKEKIEDVEKRIFLIHMVDFWTSEDRSLLLSLEKELRELNYELACRKENKNE